MSVEAAIAAVAASNNAAATAANAWKAHAEKLEALGANSPLRLAAIIGQCAHESGGFLHRFENLNYSQASLRRVFKKYFKTNAEAAAFARKPEKIANRVYGNRMGNGSEGSGDGWRYRGRGYIQLTGKSNYTNFGAAIGEDLVGNPDRAADPGIAWMVAVRYMASRKRSGKTCLQWADESDDRMVTLVINGGTHGLVDRELRTAKALTALGGSKIPPVIEQQRVLLAAGFNPGPIDGLMGSKTKAATEAAARKFGLKGADLWEKLESIA
ncbi:MULTISPECIES: glycoside hydrolase family 19 protein [unclassified Meridianimarinicoccus]|uniref:glycoside hydrolase family 19 protein n=1 Tax=unclassified Meridianimarinicoccus TaxID=2923344 RepID=UPI00186902A8|nr:glycoside hydrolase family 19 protein [Fluviibacterium sp. MJW13]